MGKMVSLVQCNNRMEAEMLHALLNSAGVTSVVTADDVGGLYGFKFTLSAAGGAKVLVDESDLISARQIIESI